MATPTYELIETTTLASSASSVTFSSITQDYRDLVLVVEAVDDASNSGPAVFLRFNSDSGSNYSFVYMGGNGSSTASSSSSGMGQINLGTTPDNETMFCLVQVMDYSATDKHKSVLARTNNGSANYEVNATAGRYASTSAITSIEFETGLGRFYATGTKITIYGIASEVV